MSSHRSKRVVSWFPRSGGTLALALAAALAGARAAGAAKDCLTPLATNPSWSCHAELSTGMPVDYCVAFTHAFGDDPASRSFRLNVTGPFPRICTCGAKATQEGAEFGEGASYECLDSVTDTVESGKISKQKLSGQTFNTSVDVRSTFSCKPDPTCTVQPVLEPKLAPIFGQAAVTNAESGSVVVAASGSIDVGYLGCTGFASEAPSATFDTTNAGPGGAFTILYTENSAEDVAASIVVQTPSGETFCGTNRVAFNPMRERGLYRVWVAARDAQSILDGTLFGTHLQGI